MIPAHSFVDDTSWSQCGVGNALLFDGCASVASGAASLPPPRSQQEAAADHGGTGIAADLSTALALFVGVMAFMAGELR